MSVIHTTRIDWKGMALDVGYQNSCEFDPVYIVPVDVVGGEGPYCNDILHDLNSGAIHKIGIAVLASGIDDKTLRNKRAAHVYESSKGYESLPAQVKQEKEHG